MGDLEAVLAGAVLDRFIIERRLGEGGWARVLLARRQTTGELVAIKVLRPEFARVIGADRFHREISLLTGLSHPNILPLLESGQAGGVPYYVMPHASGGSLRDRLGRMKQMSVAEAVAVATGVAAALDHAHARSILHRDIKPDNILFLRERPVVSDFGIARAMFAAGGEEFSSSGLIAGTPEYMSPEQAAGAHELDHRSDLYALGCVLYEMLAGQPPFTGATAQAVISRHTHEHPPPLRVVRPDVPVHVEQAILSALEKRAAERPANGRALLRLVASST